jgi:phospholipid transport system substrate-binding protein
MTLKGKIMRLQLVIFIILLTCSFLLQANEESPGKIVKQTVDNVLDVLKNKSFTEEKRKQIISELIKDRINFKDMSRRILATNWKLATEEQKKEFISLFQKVLVNTYWTRIKRYAGERVKYITVSIDNENYATVDTIIVRDKSDIEIPISYRMKRFVNVWFAYDFIVERLSLVQSYRNEYRAIIKNFGIDGLLEQMKQEIETSRT